ncbi:MAG: hypothetical protein BWY43_00360 [candidate division WS2 bacterium ADurb.Bin280]|uniref:Uncharacterized protein n=1 Tax=candidate division WS2 bacterium ADurb.Bin280 TaxID=1852829 RepID=A0A1V5SDX8_9BACT|nr:MAG: hypothetical protein BWY43_00360 [candidate division WS2 bacterium ADurb.Bin280]
MSRAMEIAEAGGGKLVRILMACTALSEEGAGLVVSWIEQAMSRSRFNQFTDFDKVLRHITLAISVGIGELEFSLEAHGFPSLPASPGKEQTVCAIKMALSRPDALREHIESLPEL